MGDKNKEKYKDMTLSSFELQGKMEWEGTGRHPLTDPSSAVSQGGEKRGSKRKSKSLQFSHPLAEHKKGQKQHPYVNPPTPPPTLKRSPGADLDGREHF